MKNSQIEDNSKPIILYVGNDKELLSKIEGNGLFEIINKQNGFLASNWLKTEGKKPFGIISEIDLPGMSGFVLEKESLFTEKTDSIPFILIQNNYSEEEYKTALEQKIDDLYNKTVPVQDLLERMKFLADYRKRYPRLKEIKNHQLDFDVPKVPVWKRTFDIVFAGTAMLFLSPVFFAIILAIRIESKGPIFYSGKRVGRGLEPFPFHKFRTMRVGADKQAEELMKKLNQYKKGPELIPISECPRCIEKGEPCSTVLHMDDMEVCEYQKNRYNNDKSKYLKIKNDPRITKVGRILRKTSLDELPQLLNVLKGEMSIVGNRPIPPYESEKITKGDWIERFAAPAGITGLWQVEKRGKDDMSEEERLRLDIEYAKNISFLGDLKLILRTFTAFYQHEDV